MHARVLAVLVITGSASACARRSSEPPRLVLGASSAVVDAKVRDVRFGKPPLSFPEVDIVLRNPSREPRWLLVAQRMGEAGGDGRVATSESMIDAYLLSAHPRVVLVGAFMDFWAVRLPGGGSVGLDTLSFQAWWSKTPPSATLEALVAREITVGGVPLAELFGGESTSESGFDVAATDTQHKLLRTWRGPIEPGSEYPSSQPVAIDVESRVLLSVPIPR